MYCDRCGSSLAASARYCTSCGKEIYPGTPPRTYAASPAPPANPFYQAGGYDGRVQRHVRTLALLWCLNGVLRVMEVFAFYAIGHAIWPWFGHSFIGRFPFGAFPMFGWLWTLPFFAFFGFVHLLLAWSLYERKPWARALGLVVGFLALIRFPLGTALGIYTIWVLLPEASGREYERLAHA